MTVLNTFPPAPQISLDHMKSPDRSLRFVFRATQSGGSTASIMCVFFSETGTPAQKNVIGTALNRDSRGGRGVLDSLSMRRRLEPTLGLLTQIIDALCLPAAAGSRDQARQGFFRCA